MPTRIVWFKKADAEHHDGISFTKVNGWIRAKLVVPNKKSRSRSKGNDLEKSAANVLNDWLYEGRKVFRRTPLSGGWSSQKMGDVCVDPEVLRRTKKFFVPEIYVECRNYRDLLQHNFFTWVHENSPRQLTSWIKEVDSKCDGRMPILILKGNGTRPWVLVLHRWLTDYMVGQITRLKGLIVFVAQFKKARFGYIFPLAFLGRLGNAEDFFSIGREDADPASVRRTRSPV